MKKVDFILADVNTVKGEEKYYGPKIYKFPQIWNSHCGFKIKKYLNGLPFKKNGHITFGSLNNFMKVNDEVLDVWVNILKEIKNSKIILKSSLYVCEDVIRKKFEKEGLKDSVIILKKTMRNDFLSHINVYDKIDICLDKKSLFIKNYMLSGNIMIELYTNYQIRKNKLGEVIGNYVLTTPGRIIMNRLILNVLK